MTDEIIVPAGLDRVFLLPGEFHITKQPKYIATLLGSCVSVCVYNKRNGSAAMNHFVRDEALDSREKDIGRFSQDIYLIECLKKVFAYCETAMFFPNNNIPAGGITFVET